MGTAYQLALAFAASNVHALTMDDEVWVRCPFCHEKQLLLVDPDTSGSFVQDCDVCCHPWQVYVSRDEDGELSVNIERGN